MNLYCGPNPGSLEMEFRGEVVKNCVGILEGRASPIHGHGFGGGAGLHRCSWIMKLSNL